MTKPLLAIAADRGRLAAAALMLLCAIQIVFAFSSFGAEMVHVAVQSRVERWEARGQVPDTLELERAVTELEPAFARKPRWADLYELRARLSLQLLNEPNLPVDALDTIVEVAREDLERAAGLEPVSPRPHLQQLALDSLMYLAGTDAYAERVRDVYHRAPTSRLHLQRLLVITTKDWERLDEGTRGLTVTALNDLAVAEPELARSLLRRAPGTGEICARVDFEC